MHAVLAVGGSDSAAAAGIQADLKTISAHGAYALTAVTAVTAQDARRVAAIHPVPADLLAAQLGALFRSFPIAAVKSGMMADAERVEVLRDALARWRPARYVLDPVIAASSGRRLLDDAGVAALRRDLLPLASLATPNIAEAECLSGRTIRTLADARAAGRAIADLGCGAVLVKGGHLPSDPATDLLLAPDGGERIFRGRFLDTPGARGSGCTLASAIATHLAQGRTLEDAVARAKAYVAAAIRHAPALGAGDGPQPLGHFAAAAP